MLFKQKRKENRLITQYRLREIHALECCFPKNWSLINIFRSFSVYDGVFYNNYGPDTNQDFIYALSSNGTELTADGVNTSLSISLKDLSEYQDLSRMPHAGSGR